MTEPVQPGTPQATGDPAAVDPWAPPALGATPASEPAPVPPPAPAPGLVPGPDMNAGAGTGVSYWPFPQPAPQPRNGLGVAAMTLGIVGAVLGLTIVFFWLAWLPALLAVILGAVALSHVRKGLANNRGIALTGVILGAAGLLVSVAGGVLVAVQVHSIREEQRAATAAADAEAARQRDEVARQLAQFEAEKQKRATDEQARRLSFGGSYTYEETGLKISLAAPQPFVPDESVSKAPENAKVVVLAVTVVNTGSTPLSLRGSQMLFVKDANDKLLFPLVDISGRISRIPASLDPGRSVTAQEVYALPDGSAHTISVRFDHGDGSKRRAVIWTGSPG
ncbi:DUF4190 domain-containing protein [Kitasatospora sp. DSM 101779]|uniref:DUF4190 domain-containing protein n=1 Tax=Kitasatospora sp. DSM 101779 TaxID=2853165 RepID=UPI0021DAB703|nr:DUF4190 domain-containing protein [Kitasatospora sp. DSM 101779]MCU7827083.1 DUF4190 domain-containing protein [Kitasatospora sp. DSM 101779]